MIIYCLVLSFVILEIPHKRNCTQFLDPILLIFVCFFLFSFLVFMYKTVEVDIIAHLAQYQTYTSEHIYFTEMIVFPSIQSACLRNMLFC